MTEQLQKKVDFAIRLLRSIPQDSPIEVSYSGGKDSEYSDSLAIPCRIDQLKQELQQLKRKK